MPRLVGKVAIITGAVGGIGEACARLFRAEGARLLLVDLHEDKLQKLCAELGEADCSYQVADVSKAEDTEKYIQSTIKTYGALHILVCNAGIFTTPAPAWEVEEKDFDRSLAVNVKGVWLSIKYAIPEMAKSGGGSIVMVSSVAGIRGQVRAASYVASKHAVVGLMRTVAIEAAKLNIRVNTINPGPIETDMVRGLEDAISQSDREKAQHLIQKNIPMKRYGKANEVANLVLFLSGEESGFITGSIHTVDGGLSAS